MKIIKPSAEKKVERDERSCIEKERDKLKAERDKLKAERDAAHTALREALDGWERDIDRLRKVLP